MVLGLTHSAACSQAISGSKPLSRRLISAAAVHSRPVVPSNKPVRSRKLPPEEHDPEELGLSVTHYPPWIVPGSDEPTGLQPWNAAGALPSAYSSSDVFTDDAEAAPEQPEGGREVAGGAYLAHPIQARQLIAAARGPKLWELLGLDASYADDFFRGPDYRYAVDDEGHIQDMVLHKRQRIPQPFQYAFTSQQPPDTPLGLAFGLQGASQQEDNPVGPSLTAADGRGQALADTAGDGNSRVGRRRAGFLWDDAGVDSSAQDSYLEELGLGVASSVKPTRRQSNHVATPVMVSGSAMSQRGAAAARGTAGRRWVAGSQGKTEAASWPAVQPPVIPLPSVEPSINALGRGGAGFNKSGLSGPGSPPLIGQLLSLPQSGAPGAPAATSTRLKAADKTSSAGGPPDTDMRPLITHRSIPDNSNVHGTDSLGSGGDGDLAGRKQGLGLSTALGGLAGSDGAVRALRAFPYCIGPRDVFQGLWELDLLQQLVFTDDLEAADLVLHRRARPKENQFAYNRLRERARRRGIPFVTVKDGDAQELAASLIPVFQLYRGELSPQEVKRIYGTAGVGSRKKRIRL